MKLEKDGIVKEIEDRMAGDYMSAGWKKTEENKKDFKEDSKEEKKHRFKDEY